jgi:hypothetical protein
MVAAARVTGAARDLASDLAEGFRKTDRAVKHRGAVLGTWVLLSLVCLWVACPPSGPSNSLGAVVRVLPSSIMGTQLLIHNDSDRLWTDVTFTLDGAWRHEWRTVRPGDKVVLAASSFARGVERAPRDYTPRTLRIECREGEVTATLLAR